MQGLDLVVCASSDEAAIKKVGKTGLPMPGADTVKGFSSVCGCARLQPSLPCTYTKCLASKLLLLLHRFCGLVCAGAAQGHNFAF